jgi:hypothetical protein
MQKKSDSYKKDLIQLFRLVEDCIDLEATVAAVSHARDTQDLMNFKKNISAKLEQLGDDISSIYDAYNTIYGKYFVIICWYTK